MHLAVKSGRSRNTPLSLPAGRAELGNPTARDRIELPVHGYHGCPGRVHQRSFYCRRAHGTDHVYRPCSEIGREPRQELASAFREGWDDCRVGGGSACVHSPSLTAIIRDPTAAEPG